MNYYRENQAAFLEGLKAWLRIPSISTLSEHKPDIRRAAEFALNELRAAGLAGELIEGEGNPLVFAEWTGAPGAPTLLLYGHYDVQPPDPLDEWKSPPFEPEVRGHDIFARGSSDDKGQTYIIIKAARAAGLAFIADIQQYGLNEYAAPGVGEGFVTSSLIAAAAGMGVAPGNVPPKYFDRYHTPEE